MTYDVADEVSIVTIDSDTELYRHYQRESNPQPVYFYLDLETGVLSATYDAEVGGAVSRSVYSRRTLLHYVRQPGGYGSEPAPIPTAASANELLTKLFPIAQKILAGAEIEHDGNNWVGILNDDAAEAEDEFTALIDAWADRGGNEEGVLVIHQADDWFSPAPPEKITATTTDDELAAIEAAELQTGQESVHASNVLVIEGITEYLKNYRQERRDEADES